MLSKLWVFLKGFELAFTPQNTLLTVVNVLGYVGVIVAGYLGYRAVERRMRRRHSVDTLIPVLMSPDFSDGMRLLDDHIARDLYVSESHLKEDDNLDDSRSLDMLMNYYDFLASAYRRNFLDKEVVKSLKIKLIHDSYIVLEELIKERRARWDRPTYMREFELLAGSFAPHMKKALGIQNPLSRTKMLKNPLNKDRLFVPTPNLRAVA